MTINDTAQETDRTYTRPVPRLSIKGLSKLYGNGSSAVSVIENLSVDIQAGEFVCLVGPSGAGKTTLLRCMAGLMNPTSGTVQLDGEKVLGPPRKMAVVFQDYTRSLLPWLTVEKNVTLPLRSQGLPRQKIEERCDQALAAVGLLDARARYPWQLSGGMQQRVAIARALAFKPEVLVMDEPFASVDAQTRFDLEDLVLQVQRDMGITILLVTHDIDEAVYLADRVVVLSKGPCAVKADIRVDIPKPRNQITSRAKPVFSEVRTEVMLLIQAEANKGASRGI